MIRRLCISVFALLVSAVAAMAIDDTSIPAKFSIPWANSAGGAYLRAIPTTSQIGIQNCAASLTDGFPPLTFVPASAGGCPPFGQDMNGILQQITQWSRWQAAGGQVPWDSAFSAAIAGYPKGSIIASATFGQLWLNTVENNVTNPDAAGAGWQNFYIGWTGVTAGSYVRPQITVAADGKITAAANGAYPTRTQLTSGSGNYSIPVGAKRLIIRMVGGGGGGGGPGGSGSNGVATSFNSIVANPGIGASTNSGGASPSAGAGTASLRIPGSPGNDGGLTNSSGLNQRAMGGPGGHAAFFSGGGKAGAASAGVPNTGGGGGGTSSDSGGSTTGGGGGSAGEYVEIIINGAVGPYAYVIGTGGAGGGGGGAGAAGRIIIDEFFD